MREREGQERVESLLLLIVPLLIGVSLYLPGLIEEVTGHYAVYTVYIVGSLALTKHNGRTLSEIGLTGRGFVSSFGDSVAFVVGVFAVRLFRGALSLSADVFSLTAFAYNLFYWGLSGLGQEVIFRGLILFSFYRWKGERVALVVSSALFMVVHILEYQSAFSLLFFGAEGLYWGWVALRTRNIVGIAVSHTLYNFIFSYSFAP
jgi:membrane protease YdiL (CAAX protease family)